jgi:presenilin-like A22 family membrane protease
VGLFLSAPALKITQTVFDEETNTTQEVIIAQQELAGGGERPQSEYPVVFIATAIAIGTLLILLLVKYKLYKLWKVWFFLAVLYTLFQSFNAYPILPLWATFLLAVLLSVWKIYFPNIFIHNLTEIFVYAGLAIVFVPVLQVHHMILLLFLISAYDMYAVWKSKHMVEMAKFQSESSVFAGVSIPYALGRKAKKGSATKKVKVRTAILGGGDIGFPLLFAGVVMQKLANMPEIASQVVGLDPISRGLLLSSLLLPKVLIITFCTTIALGLLFYFAEKDKFYPAMPFVSAGCLVGYGLLLLLF